MGFAATNSPAPDLHLKPAGDPALFSLCGNVLNSESDCERIGWLLNCYPDLTVLLGFTPHLSTSLQSQRGVC